MFFKENIRITTIDGVGTKRREDGFRIDLVTGIISLVSVVPDFDRANFDEVKRVLIGDYSERSTKVLFFPNSTSNGFTSTKEQKSIVVEIKPPHNQATVGIGKAIIERQMIDIEADGFLETDPILRKACDFVSSDPCYKKNPLLTSADLIFHLNFKFNYACADAMKKAGIPHLGSKEGKACLFRGFPRINSPLRNPVAFINCFQLTTYLETGEIYFSRQDLEELIKNVPQ